MSEFRQLIITNKGQSLIAKLIAGKANVTFTKVAASATTYNDSQIPVLTALSNIKQQVAVSKVTRINSVAVQVDAAMENSALTTGYYMNSIGLYANDPDDGEILYAVAGANVGAYMPPYNGITVSGAYLKLVTTVSNASNVSMTVDPAAVATVGDINALQAEITDIQSYIGYTDPDIYGVEVDWKNNKFTRLSSAIGKNGGSDFDNIAPWDRRRCNVTDAGEVVAYYGDDGYTETGKLTQAITIDDKTWQVGTRVQVMVEQNMFFYKMVPLSLEPANDGYGWKVRKARYYISATPKAGFKLFPAFRRNGKVVTKIYDSAFEACIYDTSAGSYVTDDSVIADLAKATGDKLASVANVKPVTGLTNNFSRKNARILAENIGTGWMQGDFLVDTMTEWLFLIEYASMDAQSKIGKGVCDFSPPYNMESHVVFTGRTSRLGNASGMATGTNGETSITYRGKENLFGNLTKWSDGLNYNGTTKHAYWADHGFVDDTDASPYSDCGFALAGARGFISAFGWSEDCDFAFLPTETTGDSSKPVGDYHDWGPNWRVATLGGSWWEGLNCGLYYWSLGCGSGLSTITNGGRLVYIPTVV